jgi:negative regulator of sigma E activity
MHSPQDTPHGSDPIRELDALMQDKLEAHCRQQLSAMVDGALAPDEARFLLRRLQHDGELAGRWERWQVYGDLMRGGVSQLLPADFSQRVVMALQTEDDALRAQPAVAARGARSGWTRWAGGAALAASVAVAALVVVQRDPQGANPQGAPNVAIVEGATRNANISAAADLVATASSASEAPVIASTSTPPPPAGTPTEAGGGVAVAAVAALAAGDARRASRRQASRPGTATDARAQTINEPAAPLQAVAVAQADTHAADTAQAGRDPFGIGEPATARPWPRAVLPGLEQRGFNVGYGAQAQPSTEPSAFEFFEPQLPPEQRSDDAQAQSTANR